MSDVVWLAHCLKQRGLNYQYDHIFMYEQLVKIVFFSHSHYQNQLGQETMIA